MNSLQVMSLLRLYNQLSLDERLVFLANIAETSNDFRQAAIITELNKNGIDNPFVRQLITSDKYIQSEVIIDPHVVEHLSIEIKDQLSKVKFICKSYDPYFHNKSDYYIMLNFDITDPPAIFDENILIKNVFEPFELSKLDTTIGPMFWDIYDEDGYLTEISLFEE